MTFHLRVYRDVIYSSIRLFLPHMIWPRKEMSSVHYDTSFLPGALHLGANRINMDVIFSTKPSVGRLELLSVETGHMTDSLVCVLGDARGLTGVES